MIARAGKAPWSSGYGISLISPSLGVRFPSLPIVKMEVASQSFSETVKPRASVAEDKDRFKTLFCLILAMVCRYRNPTLVEANELLF